MIKNPSASILTGINTQADPGINSRADNIPDTNPADSLCFQVTFSGSIPKVLGMSLIAVVISHIANPDL